MPSGAAAAAAAEYEEGEAPAALASTSNQISDPGDVVVGYEELETAWGGDARWAAVSEEQRREAYGRRFGAALARREARRQRARDEFVALLKVRGSTELHFNGCWGIGWPAGGTTALSSFHPLSSHRSASA